MTQAPPTPEESAREERLRAWRAGFPAAARLRYLDSASHGLPSIAVSAALAEYVASYQDGVAPWETEWRQAYDDVRASAARLLGADRDDMAVLTSATQALQSALSSMTVEGTRNVVLVAEREWPSSHHVVDADGRFRVEVAPATEPAGGPAFVSRIGPDTCLVIVSAVCYATGARTDLTTVARAAHAHGARVFADLSQSAGVVPVDLRATGVDFATTGFLKYLLGIPGAALLYVRPDLADTAAPRLSGWRGRAEPSLRIDAPLATGARRFEAGTWPVASLYGARAGLATIFDGGPKTIADHVTALAKRFARGARAIGLTVLTPHDDGPSVVLDVGDGPAAAATLATHDVHATGRGRTLRCSFHAYLRFVDVDAVLDVMAHTLRPTGGTS